MANMQSFRYEPCSLRDMVEEFLDARASPANFNVSDTVNSGKCSSISDV
jgi:hypothetical protein